jgi:hypothetical protein
MSAAAEVDDEAAVKEYLTRAFTDTCYDTGAKTWGTKLLITFTIGGKTFHTVLQLGRQMTKYDPPRFKGDKEKHNPQTYFHTFVGKLEYHENLHKPSTCIYFETECKGVTALQVPTSQIHADDTTKKCFDPPLTKTTVPEGYTQTDILQVFLTKLKLLQVRDVFLLDAARIPLKYDETLAYLTVWRLLQGKLGVYEKYGYVSQIFTRRHIDKMMSHRQEQHLALIGEGAIGYERAFDIVRRLATTRKLKDFKDVDYYHEIMGSFEWHYPDVFMKEDGIAVYEEKTIAELISKIPYKNTWFNMRWGEGSLVNIFEILFIIVLGVSYESIGKLKLNTESAEWRKWDRELKFTAVEPFVERAPAVAPDSALGTGTGAGAGAGPFAFGGTRMRRTRRARQSRRFKTRRANYQ